MKVIILAGGQGTRLREETEFKPKALVMVGNRPILWHIMKRCSHYGYNQFILALGHKGDLIKSYFINRKYLENDFELDSKTEELKIINDSGDDFKITFVDTGLNTKTAGRILACKKYISEKDASFIVSYCDTVSDFNIKKIVKFHQKQNTLATIAGCHPRSKYGGLEVGKNNLVNALIEKSTMADWVNGGLVIYKREAFKYFKPKEMDFETIDRIARKKQLSLYKHEGFWYAVDTYKELEDLNKLWENNNRPWKIWS